MVRPSGSAGGGTAVLSIVLPATVLDVWTPWPKVGLASGSGPLQAPVPSVELQSYAVSFGLAPLKPQVASSANDGWSLFVPPSMIAARIPSPWVPTPVGVEVPSQILSAPM